MNRIRWRLNDPAEEWQQRWTKVHVLHPGTSATATGRFGVLVPSNEERTLCGLTVPEHPYMEDRSENIPAAELPCWRCHVRAKRMRLS